MFKKLIVLFVVAVMIASTSPIFAQGVTLQDLDIQYQRLATQKVEIEKEMLRLEGQYRERKAALERQVKEAQSMVQASVEQSVDPVDLSEEQNK